MAQGYARSRPPIHSWVIERVSERLAPSVPLRRALDVGCGAGLSTAPLVRLARERLGIEPAVAMLRQGAAVAPGARFAVAQAERLPLAAGTIDVITAAGSLNYVDLGRFFPEARRVLAPGGSLVVYDFGQGRAFSGGGALARWFSEFEARHPLPPHAARELSPSILASLESGFLLADSLEFELALPFTAERYLDYVMSEANVPHAIATGADSEAGLRASCAATLPDVFERGERSVLFAGYLAILRPGPNPRGDHAAA